MNQSKAAKMAKELAVAGEDYADIGKRLAEAGYVSRRGGGPLTGTAVSYLLLRNGFRKRRSRKSETVTPRRAVPRKQGGGQDRKTLIRSIVRLAGVDADTKLSLIELVADL